MCPWRECKGDRAPQCILCKKDREIQGWLRDRDREVGEVRKGEGVSGLLAAHTCSSFPRCSQEPSGCPFPSPPLPSLPFPLTAPHRSSCIIHCLSSTRSDFILLFVLRCGPVRPCPALPRADRPIQGSSPDHDPVRFRPSSPWKPWTLEPLERQPDPHMASHRPDRIRTPCVTQGEESREGGGEDDCSDLVRRDQPSCHRTAIMHR